MDLILSKIYTSYEPSQETIPKILMEIMETFDSNAETCASLINRYKGDQTEDIPDTISDNANEKIVINLTKHVIDALVSLTYNSPILIATESDDEQKKADLEVLRKYLVDIADYSNDIDAFTDTCICGKGYNYVLQVEDDEQAMICGTFSPENTAVVYGRYVPEPVVLAVHKSIIKREVDGELQEFERFTCFDKSNKYVLERVDDTYSYVEEGITAHDLPNIPIQSLDLNKYFTSITQEIRGFSQSANISSSTAVNDLLINLNQLLVISGVTDSDVAFERLRESGVLIIPPTQSGQLATVQFISSKISEWILSYWELVIKTANTFLGIPTESNSNGETGRAVSMQNGHVMSSFLANTRATRLIVSKRKQIANMLTILQRKGLITDNLKISDIVVSFDNNRLLNIADMTTAIRDLLDKGFPPYEVLKLFGYSANIKEIADGIEDYRGVEHDKAMQIKWGENYKGYTSNATTY